MIAISSAADRPKAFALIALATTLSIVAGPGNPRLQETHKQSPRSVTQLAFSWIHYPGYTVFSNVHINLYTAPVWISSLLNFVSITVILYFLEEKLLNNKKEGKSQETINSRWPSKYWAFPALFQLSKFLVFLLLSINYRII